MKKPKSIFIAGTMQNDGKTTVALGLISVLKKKIRKIGFIKPVGQRYILEEGYKVDEDSVLIEKIFHFPFNIKDMNPIAVERGFTEEYILKGKGETIGRKITEAYQRISEKSDLIIIEGTGHAGVGSCFEFSNARVAKLLNAPVLLISSGGIGKPIDEILLNKALFDKEGVRVLGVIINKVLKEKYGKVKKLITLSFKKHNIEVLGLVPYDKLLLIPTVKQIGEKLKLKFLNFSKWVDYRIKKIVVGAMEPHDALNYFEDGSFIITPGDREDIILSTMSFHLTRRRKGGRISGILLTGNLIPHKRILNLLRLAKIPVLLSSEDTYTTASRVHDLMVKITPEDKDKIREIKNLVERYVNIDKLLSLI